MVRFFNGGVLTYAYTDAGQLIELCATKLMVIVSKDNEVSFLVASDLCVMPQVWKDWTMAQNNLKPGDSSDDVNPGQIFQIGDGGATIIRNPDGSLDYSLNEINSVDIRDITDVVEHRINTIVGSRLHMVRFMNGGLLTYAYNNAGQLIELTSSGLSAEMSTNNDIEYYIDR